MKLKLLILTSLISIAAFAQPEQPYGPVKKTDNSAAQQGIAIVEMMEKDGSEMNLPAFCNSTRLADKKKCEIWLREQRTAPDNSAAQQGIAIVEQMEKEMACDDPKLTEDQQAMCRYKMYEESSSEDRLAGCVLSMDASEITCGEKVYVLSGKVSNMKRINSKIDLKGSSRSQKGKSTGSKANKE